MEEREEAQDSLYSTLQNTVNLFVKPKLQQTNKQNMYKLYMTTHLRDHQA